MRGLILVLILALALVAMPVRAAEFGESEVEFESVAELLKRNLDPTMLPAQGAPCGNSSGSWQGCRTGCCINGICARCDRCTPNPLTNSNKCQWCIRSGLEVSRKGCLNYGNRCTAPSSQGTNITRHHCTTGCCREGRCAYCDDCPKNSCRVCRNNKRRMNPNGRCFPKKTTTRPPAPAPPAAPTGGPVTINTTPLYALMPSSWCNEVLWVRADLANNLYCEQNSLGTGCNWRERGAAPPTSVTWRLIPPALYVPPPGGGNGAREDYAVLAYYATHFDSCAPYCPNWPKADLLDSGPCVPGAGRVGV